MENAITIVLFIVGLLLIIKGGDYFVDSASWIAKVSGVPKFIIGATIVSVGTTLPELLVSAIAAGKGQVDMAVGNAIGSVTANTGLALGLFVVCMPFVVKRSEFTFKGIMMFLATAALLVLSWSGTLTIVSSLVLFMIFLAFIAENLLLAKKETALTSVSKKESLKIKNKNDLYKNIFLFIIGAIGIAGGAQLLVVNGTKIGAMLGISERVISIVAIAIGTSLPELVTAITALRKKQGALSVGNVLGANIIDVTLILPVCSVISGGSLAVSQTALRYDIPACLIIMALAVFPTILTKKFCRWQGVFMMSTYVIYILLTIFVLK